MDRHSLTLIFIMSLVTIILRFFPFIVFRGRETPQFISYLGAVSPYAIMAMLVVYCLRNISFMSGNRGIPEVLACIFVIVLQIWRKNTLLSVGFGTVFYMALVQMIFV